MKRLCLLKLMLVLGVLPGSTALACTIGWATNKKGEEIGISCRYMFDHIEVMLVFKYLTEMRFDRDPSSRFGFEGGSIDSRTSIQSMESEEIEGENPVFPLAQPLAAIDAMLDQGAVHKAIAALKAIEVPLRKEAAFHALQLRAYELNKDYPAAGQALAHLLKLNPECHESSEWLHPFILSAKAKLEAGTLDLRQASVLSTGYPSPGVANTPKSREWSKARKKFPKSFVLYDAILTQIHLQENFYGGDKRIIADLYFELGKIAADQYWLERSVEFYELALEYGTPKTEIIQQAITHHRKLIEARPHAKEEALKELYQQAQ